MASFPITQRAETPRVPLNIVYEATVPVRGVPHDLICTIYGRSLKSITVSVDMNTAAHRVASCNVDGVALLDQEIQSVVVEFLAGVDQLEADAKEAHDLERAE